MKLLSAALALTLCVSLGIYSVLKLGLELEGSAAEAIAGFPLLALGQIYEAIEKGFGRKSLSTGHQENIPEFDRYVFRWYKIFVFAVLLFAAPINLFGAYLGIVLGAVGAKFDVALVGLMQLPIVATVSFLLGRWVGSRCRSLKGGMLVVVVAIAVVMTADRVYLVRSMTGDPSVNNAASLGDLGSGNFLLMLAGGIAIYGAFSCLGVWRGFRVRVQRYMAYLLSVLPEGDRAILVSLAYDQVQLRSSQAPRLA
jgi:hypothetical protein